MTASLFPPEGAASRVFERPAGPGRPATWTVMVALPPVEPDPANLLRSGEAAAMLTHGLGVAWPDAAGERLAAEALRLGGVVALVFAHRWDAVDCKARIDAGGAG